MFISKKNDSFVFGFVFLNLAKTESRDPMWNWILQFEALQIGKKTGANAIEINVSFLSFL